MSDEARPPQPRYGQYATSEEQRARMGEPASAARPVSPPAPEVAARPALSPGRLIDRAATVALLVYGIVSVVQSIPVVLDATRLLQTMGIDAELADPAGMRGWGVLAVVVLTLGWIATALFAWRRARRGRMTFWIPIVGAVVFNVIASLIVAGPLVGDPAVMDALLRTQDALGS